MILAVLPLLRAHWRPALLVAACLVCFGLGYRQRGLEEAQEQAQNLTRIANARRKQEEQDAKASAGLQARLAALERTNRELTRRLYAETQKPAYRCPLPDDGLRIIADALHAPAR